MQERALTPLGGAVVRALDMRLEAVVSIPAVALTSATLDKLFTHIFQTTVSRLSRPALWSTFGQHTTK